MFPALDAFQVPGKSGNRPSPVLGLHISGNRVYQDLRPIPGNLPPKVITKH